MGNSTGSTMYMFGAVIVIYIVGMTVLSGISVDQEKKKHRKRTKSSETVKNNSRY